MVCCLQFCYGILKPTAPLWLLCYLTAQVTCMFTNIKPQTPYMFSQCSHAPSYRVVSAQVHHSCYKPEITFQLHRAASSFTTAWSQPASPSQTRRIWILLSLLSFAPKPALPLYPHPPSAVFPPHLQATPQQALTGALWLSSSWLVVPSRLS